MKRSVCAIIFTLAVFLAWGSVDTVLAQGGKDFEVTVVNSTRGQVFSPPVVISHDKDFTLFRIGEAAMSELEALAEDGQTGDLIAYISSLPSVHDYDVASGPIPPGNSDTLEVNTKGRFRYVSIAGMLVTSNDAFFCRPEHSCALPWWHGGPGNGL
jgi:hypothetical protein